VEQIGFALGRGKWRSVVKVVMDIHNTQNKENASHANANVDSLFLASLKPVKIVGKSG
jgi:hypothetical protein